MKNINIECFPVDKKYSKFELGLDSEKTKHLETLNEKKTYIAFIILVSITILIVFLSIQLTNYNFIFYFPCIFIIAGRQGAFLQLVHEASHYLVSKNHKINDFFGSYLCAFPIGVNFAGFRSGHNNHHVNTATDEDSPTDLDKYRVVDTKKLELYKLFLKDLIGISAIEVFLSYGKNNQKKIKKNNSLKHLILTIIKLSFIQLIILFLFGFNIENYILFWIIPLVSPHMFLMRIRGLAEHGQSNQLGCKAENNSAGTFYTRSFLTPLNSYKNIVLSYLERILIGSFYVHYHHEHHIFPNVPWYNLPELSSLVSGNIKKVNTANVYRKGYFSAAFNN